MVILILGASGQIGREVKKVLKHPDIRLVTPNRLTLNLCHPEKIPTYLLKTTPDLVINCAAFTDVEGAEYDEKAAFILNKSAVSKIADFCEEMQIPLIHLSTDYVFDGKKNSPYSELDKTNPETIYGRSKVEGEAEIQRKLNKHIIIRTSWVFGEYGDNFVKKILLKSQTNTKLEVINDQFGGPTSARSIAAVIKFFVFCYKTKGDLNWGIYHFSQLPFTNWFEFTKTILRISASLNFQTKAELRPISSISFNSRAIRPINSKLDSTKLFQLDRSLNRFNWEDDLIEVLTALRFRG